MECAGRSFIPGGADAPWPQRSAQRLQKAGAAMTAPAKARTKRFLGVVLTPRAFVSMAAYMHHRLPPPTQEIDTIAILVPDAVATSSVDVREWQDAASEEGLHLSVLHDSEFLNPLFKAQSVRGIVLPD